MLRLENISKSYISGGVSVPALKNISLNFRKNEFVSILGQSGCGKTTLLNIIGGLDRYTNGNLIIAGKSTKDYADKDWDSYRNHTIGFVFQNYNLIMHLSVLDNVEMALTLAGLSREERKEKAIKALESVGLGEHIHKRPNQLSGGQMQRVAIARAIVNNPKIILADEPTGALDTETSIQIMDILKELSKDILIIMVTHNPELAQQYSTRIVRLLDGVVKDDTMPYSVEEEKQEILISNESSLNPNDNKDKNTSDKDVLEAESIANNNNVQNNKELSHNDNLKKTKKCKRNRTEKTSMSFFTALKLSLQNLRTKKARTILTSIAGSVGIIGVALILALSSGFQSYVDKMQMDTLSNYPLTIERNATDLESLSDALGMGTSDSSGLKDKIYVNKILEKLMSTQKNNNITQEYIDNIIEKIDSSLYYDIQYEKDAVLNIYRKVVINGMTVYRNVNPDLSQQGGEMVSSMMGIELWSELVDNKA
ncbi:MAG: ABC transporter ATP-binding protein, partial [Christensenellales bacterium]